MCEKFSAVFEKRNGETQVFYVHHQSGDKTYLGTLDPAGEYGYEGKYVFQLEAESIVEQCETQSIHIPVNVLREIAGYGAAPKGRTLRRRR
jgi:hypothetical protein